MHFVNCILEGLLTGLVLSLMLGTVFFSLIRNSIAFGHKSGIYIVLGVIICDIIFISLAIASSSFAQFLSTYQNEVSIIGGSILTLMGIVMFFKAKPKDTEGKLFDKQHKMALYLIGNGFILNAVNPVNFFSWLSISSVLRIKMHYNNYDLIIYFTACLMSIFIVEIGIAYFAAKLKTFMQAKTVTRINQIVALVFIVVGVKLLLS
jgi:threonine/homoserine/homoserine lactone efflux protein